MTNKGASSICALERVSECVRKMDTAIKLRDILDSFEKNTHFCHKQNFAHLCISFLKEAVADEENNSDFALVMVQ